MPVAIGLIASAIIGGGMSAYSANEQENAMTAAANRQNDFQQRNSNTAYQRATEDMKAAGLNPMLAYSQGGASTPSGALAGTTDPLGGSGHEIAQLPEKLAGLQNTSANTAKAKAETGGIEAGVYKTLADTRLTNANAAQQEWINKNDLGLKTRGLKWGTTSTEIKAKEDEARRSAQVEPWKRDVRGPNYYDTQVDQARADVADTGLDIALKATHMPGASAQAQVDQSWYGQNVRPYLPDLSSLLNSAGSAAEAIAPGRGRLPASEAHKFYRGRRVSP
ncbi:DNA pilot protein [Blackfly microvirus SF02]|uniref:DNA pilot protein n=1 Tax=Blackfly microvirus SF02 TaxID=2576452 RepID=A0A4P8PTJ8_9VIRU|nr:DNA pilot protein [Blackfly microvirus SF02]